MSQPLVAIRRRADLAFERYKALSQPQGSIVVGGAHFDEYLTWLLLNTFLAHLPDHTLEEARDEAAAAGNEALAHWNAGRLETRRFERAEENPVLWWAYRLARQAGGTP